MAEILIYLGSIIVMIWGIAHIFPVKSVVSGFGQISEDNKKIIFMEWLAEGLTLLFIGSIAILVVMESGIHDPISLIVIHTSAIFLLILAGLSAMTGARTSILPMKICPVIKTGCAILFLAGTIIY